jgi:hypothetical protein
VCFRERASVLLRGAARNSTQHALPSYAVSASSRR